MPIIVWFLEPVKTIPPERVVKEFRKVESPGGRVKLEYESSSSTVGDVSSGSHSNVVSTVASGLTLACKVAELE